MTKKYNNLTYALLNAYGNRKKPGRFSILIDIEDKEGVYIVPRNIEHIDFVKKVFLTSDKERLSKLVPSHIQVEPNSSCIDEVVGLFTGNSGLEIRYGARHIKHDLELAHKIAWDFVCGGEVPVGKIEENKIDSRYLAK